MILCTSSFKVIFGSTRYKTFQLQLLLQLDTCSSWAYLFLEQRCFCHGWYLLVDFDDDFSYKRSDYALISKLNERFPTISPKNIN